MSSPHSPVFEALFPTPLGPMVALASDAALECLYFADQPHPPALSHLPASRLPALFLSSDSSPAARVLQATSQWLDSYFAGENPSASLVAVSSPASTVAQAVFSHLAAIPLGQTTTYQALAHEVEVSTGKPTSARGVASVLAHNPALLLRPCHRVVASSGALSGYAGGVERKRELLTLERTWAGLA